MDPGYLARFTAPPQEGVMYEDYKKKEGTWVAVDDVRLLRRLTLDSESITYEEFLE